jgi:hypothetical protein
MRRVLKYGLLGAALLACMAVPVQASVTLTFEGLGDLEPIFNYFDGGFGGHGSGPGPNYGVVFGADSLALISRDVGGSGNFTGSLAPSPNTVAFYLSGNGDVMNVAGGFNTGFSFYYAAPFYTGSVAVYSGLDGTGTLLASLFLPLTGVGTRYYYDDWRPIGVSFPGTAESAIFSGTANFIIFDNITLGSSHPGGVPEPSTFAIAGLSCLGFIGCALRRRRSAA